MIALFGDHTLDVAFLTRSRYIPAATYAFLFNKSLINSFIGSYEHNF